MYTVIVTQSNRLSIGSARANPNRLGKITEQPSVFRLWYSSLNVLTFYSNLMGAVNSTCLGNLAPINCVNFSGFGLTNLLPPCSWSFEGPPKRALCMGAGINEHDVRSMRQNLASSNWSAPGEWNLEEET